MSDDEDIAALVVDNGSGMCKGASSRVFGRGFQTKPIRGQILLSQAFRQNEITIHPFPGKIDGSGWFSSLK